MDDRKIGIFDSGLGGLTVVRELLRIAPSENIVYFGDTGRVPYGNKSKSTILRYAMQSVDFLKSQNCKLIIAACGTVSAVASGELDSFAGMKLFRVVIPAAQAACATTTNGRIGVIGTRATIRSAAYGKAIHKINPNNTVVGKSCPLFVPLVENGHIGKDDPITKLVCDEYLSFFITEDIDTLILGCTHYPILFEAINHKLDYKVTLIDSGAVTARAAVGYLTENGMLASDGISQLDFFVSDEVDSFRETAGIFLGTSAKMNANIVVLGE